MNVHVAHFIDRLRQDNHFPEIGRDYVTWDGITLRVHRSLDEDSPLRYELTWPSTSDPGVAIYPTLLCECVLGPTFHYPAFTQRAAPFIHQGSTHLEMWENWEIRAFTAASNPVLSLSKVELGE